MVTSRGAIPYADQLRMIELYKSGMQIREIADTVGWTPGGIYKAIKKFGVALRETKTKPHRGSVLARARNRIGVW